MCDFSISQAKSRPAVVADKLVSFNFGRGTIGFKPVDDPIGDATAVCLMPGTELAFDKVPVLRYGYESENKPLTDKVARFRQINKDKPSMHHDALEFPDGRIVLLTHLESDQAAVVLQLPAKPRNEAEVQEQTRAEFVG